MENKELFEKLLRAETEGEVDTVLSDAGYMDEEKAWCPLGFENNFAAIGNQQSDASGALVEKIINGIDAVLMAECYSHNIDPEGPNAPRTMATAVEQFFGVRDGRLDNLTAKEQGLLADNIHLIAVGSKESPNYLIIDRGEGQTPAQFPRTFVSLLRSNKIRIPFVQGKFNSGGTGILQFCGNRNYELFVSRRRPNCPVDADDETAGLWGFTIVRRLLPSSGRRSSMFVYLAPDGQVPSFRAEAIKVLPGKSSVNHPAPPYAIDLPYGTCVKLYNYIWRNKSLLTTEGRYELERFLHSPCLPFRITETREYRAHLYSATVIGGWASAIGESDDAGSSKMEVGFPAYAVLNILGVGTLPYQIGVFKEISDKRHVPNGIFFVVNGQVHGSLPSDFISRHLKFDYLIGKNGPLFVSIDCTAMNERVREDFFMSSRDRIRKNEIYSLIEDKLTDVLRSHPGLQEINQRRRKQALESTLNEKAPLEAFQKLIDLDPTLSNLFAIGDRLVASTGPVEKASFIGRKFPTYFRLANEPKGGLLKPCPINRTCRIELETDAVNDYFTRAVDPGKIMIVPPDLIEHSHLWNGNFETRFRVPWDAKPGDFFEVKIAVTDIAREARGMPFVSIFTLKAEAEVEDDPHPGQPNRSRGAISNGNKKGLALSLPTITEVHKEEWEQYNFDRYDAINIKHGGQEGYDFYVNVDNAFLLTELAKAKDEDKPLIKFWFCYGLVLAALGMIRHQMRIGEKNQIIRDQRHMDLNQDDPVDLDMTSNYCSGLARVIVPIIRTLNRGPVYLAA